MAIEPTPGLVIYYDFLWKEESDLGREQGQKDRPCAIIMKSEPQDDGSCNVLVCPITHSPVEEGETGVPIPLAVAQHLGLDDESQFIKTHQLNQISWPDRALPYGVVPNKQGEWTCGEIPQALAKAVFDQVNENATGRLLQSVVRD